MISFTVYGQPIPQGSKRAFVNPKTGRPILVESSDKNLKAWRRQIQVAAGMEMNGRPLLEGPLSLTAVFAMKKPKSAPKRKKIFPITRPDLSKLLRACEDAMAGIVYRDDSQIVRLSIAKIYDNPPRVDIKIEQVDQEL